MNFLLFGPSDDINGPSEEDDIEKSVTKQIKAFGSSDIVYVMFELDDHIIIDANILITCMLPILWS